MNSYSAYVTQPADRDLERMSAELRALPTPVTRCAGTGAPRTSWLRRHLHLRPTHA